MTVPPLLAREGAWERLRAGVDVLVIGGGITGAGVLLDAATRGFRAALVEQQDYAGGTSSRSTKLVHGGLRYLPQWQIGLVREALHERDRLRRLAPHLVRPLPFLVPVYRDLRRPLGIRVPVLLRLFTGTGIRLGLTGYDLLAGGDLPHQSLSGDEARGYVPALRTEGLRRAFLYYDAVTDDVRLTHAILATARRHGAIALNYARAAGLTFDDHVRVSLHDQLSGQRVDVRARYVVNATGIWAERVAALAGPVPFRIRHGKGVHLILHRPDLVERAALVIPETDDGRLAFLVPWRGRLILGTTDDPYGGDPGAPRTTGAEAGYLLDHLNRFLRTPVGPEAIGGAFAGLRPLIARRDGRTAELSRGHEVVEHDSGLISIIGGKLTTYRKMAQDTVDVLARRAGVSTPCRTADLMLAGGDDLDAARGDGGRRAEALGLTPEQLAHLIATYGSGTLRVLDLIEEEPALAGRFLSDLPTVRAELVLACREEQALTLTDWMLLRSRLALLDRHQGRGCVAAAAALMGRELGWSPEETGRQIAAFEAAVSAEMAFLVSLQEV